ncbi:MAG: HAD-IA family hydrolase [Pseudomonadota bacterium]
MSYAAVFVGALGVIAETSEIQRLAFNAAFEKLGLEWQWEQDRYLELLKVPGGRNRIARAAEQDGICDEIDVGAAYRLKLGAYRSILDATGVHARPSVREFLAEAAALNMQRGFVTSTPREQVDALFAGLRGQITREHFDYVGEREAVVAAKPAPDIYHHALGELQLKPEEVLAVEDTPESAEAALAAGVSVIGFPGLAAQGRAFPEGVPVVEFLSPRLLRRPTKAIAAA